MSEAAELGPRGGSRWRWAAGAIAVLLVVSIVADAHGVWFAAPRSLWLYRQGTLIKVADVPAGLFGYPAPPPRRRPHLACLPTSP